MAVLDKQLPQKGKEISGKGKEISVKRASNGTDWVSNGTRRVNKYPCHFLLVVLLFARRQGVNLQLDVHRTSYGELAVRVELAIVLQ